METKRATIKREETNTYLVLEIGEAPLYEPEKHRFGHKKFASGKGKFIRNKQRK